MPLGDLTHQIRPADGDPAGALVLMHGRGTSEHDLVPLFDVLDPERRLVCAAPRAPLSLPPGGNHWYIVRQVGFPDRGTFLPTFDRLAGWVDAFAEASELPLGRVVFGGFSQGAVMSWALGAGPQRPRPAGVLAMSGFMPQVEGFELQTDLSGLAAAITHGSYDDIIPVSFGREARDRAQAAGAEVLYRESPVPHTIDPAVVPDLVAWLRARTTTTP